MKLVEEKHHFLQLSSLLKNITTILGQKSKEFNSTEGLNLLISTPIELENNGISIFISFTSAANGINPNNFLKKQRNRTYLSADYILLFDRILQNAEVQNKELFLALIEDSLDKDLEERMPGSEISLYNKRFSQGQIENYKKFQMLIERYVKLSEDPNIYKIPWKEILSFYSEQIDFNYISPKLLQYILPSLDRETISNLLGEGIIKSWKKLPLPKEDKKELKKYDITFYVPIVKGEFIFKEENRKGRATFVYDLQNKKVLNIEYKIN